MKTRKILLSLAVLVFFSGMAMASPAGEVRAGNRDYGKGAYDKALEHYRKAAKDAPNDPQVQYNIGNALHKLEQYDDAAAAYQKALSAKDRETLAKTYHNLGNTAYRQEKYDEALAYYKKALSLNSGDMDTKYNYEFIQNRDKQQQQKKNDKKNKDGKDQKDKQDKQQSDKDKAGDKDKQQKAQEEKSGMDKEDAQRILQYYNESEKNNADKRKAAQPRLPKVEEDW